MDKKSRRIGMIDPSCKVKSVIMEAFQNAAFLCEEYYDCAPDIEIKGNKTRQISSRLHGSLCIHRAHYGQR